ncbi:1-(5-phosphoribosyl)-5-[(5-phosphoribosylamino)methylideneamino]imidazole-4-carboxamide isomerase [Rapidithrix thailandica]|uniref:1-(5-phosphoribosyl)-5-[(5-phosphoribosylamino)methylideneamino] imidazole-4-carboxamide isomerase n=1 Tax=Rapidithrix thailandica TaxID=413964 RepID=A0AAW9SHR7_9BACT
MIEIIPAIDLIDGKCVRLTKGDYASKKVYNEDPLEVAKAFEDVGIKRLHLVDLDGAKVKHVVNLPVLEKIASRTNLIIDFGGGIQAEEDLKRAIDAGAHMITCGSIAVKNREMFENWVMEYGPDKIILAADTRDRKVAISGWLETSEIPVMDFIDSYTKKGVEYILCTDISKDGMLEGTSLDLYSEIQQEFPALKLIASGGVADMGDIEQLDEKGIFAVVVGKAIYERRITMEELAKRS